MLNRGRIVVLVAVMLVMAACSDAEQSADTDRLHVVVTTNIIGDLVRNVVGDDGDVEVLVPTGADPHDFQASARQVAAIVSADLVVANGLRLEEGLDDVLDSAVGDGANVFKVGETLNPQYFLEQDSSPEFDPHVWLDPLRMADAATAVAFQLAALDTTVDWEGRAEIYAQELRDADREIQDMLAPVPEERRILVTNHDSMGYFATRYGFEVVGVVIPGGSTLAEPSSAAVAALVNTVAEAGIDAIFAETTDANILAAAVAAEVGGNVTVVELYTGSLGEPGSGADTLIDMLLTNARRVADALS